MARNRKRAKERRARRPQAVTTAGNERVEAPAPIRHAAPDVELAEAQLAVGRPDIGAEPELEDELELQPAPSGGGHGGSAIGGDLAGEDGDDGSAAPLPVERARAGSRLVNFLQGSWRELQRVQWPDRRQVMQATGVVIGFVIVAGIYLGLADTVATALMKFILK